MIVYRIEHSTQVNPDTHHADGPCAPVDDFPPALRDKVLRAQRKVFDVMNGRFDKPTPWCDYNLCGIDPQEICGVDSEASLRFWFEDSVPELVAAGFVTRKYDVPDWACRVGQSGQVLFDYRHAKLVDNEEKN